MLVTTMKWGKKPKLGKTRIQQATQIQLFVISCIKDRLRIENKLVGIYSIKSAFELRFSVQLNYSEMCAFESMLPFIFIDAIDNLCSTQHTQKSPHKLLSESEKHFSCVLRYSCVYVVYTQSEKFVKYSMWMKRVMDINPQKANPTET